MINRLTLTAFLFTLSINSLFAQETNRFSLGDGIKLDGDKQLVSNKLNKYCGDIKEFHVESPQFSLAKKTELHLICNQYQDNNFQFQRIVFTIADNRLKLVQAKGFDNDRLQAFLGKPQGEYLGISVYEQGLYWLDKKSNRFVWLAKEGLHPYLFAWHNPLLSKLSYAPYPTTIDIPKLLNFDATLAISKQAFQAECPLFKVDVAKRIWLPNKPQSQTQINCFAFPYAGFPRKLEAVFGDDKLQVIWVLSGKQEETRLRLLLNQKFGKPIINNAKWEVFNKGKISLRKDKPELLILSDEMIPLYMDGFKNVE